MQEELNRIVEQLGREEPLTVDRACQLIEKLDVEIMARGAPAELGYSLLYTLTEHLAQHLQNNGTLVANERVLFDFLDDESSDNSARPVAGVLIPVEYVQSLYRSGELEKARAALEYAFIVEKMGPLPLEQLARMWSIEKALALRWIDSFYLEMKKHSQL